MIDSEIEMKELGRKHPTNTHSKRSLIRTSHVCHRRRAAGRNHQAEEYKHTHTTKAETKFSDAIVNSLKKQSRLNSIYWKYSHTNRFC